MKRLRQRIILYIFARIYTTEKHTHTDVETFHDPEVNFESTYPYIDHCV